jgi:hypothetical protein
MSSTTINKEQENISGRTFIKDGKIIWETDKWGTLGQIPIKDIKAIGEYTTSAGPLQDDWFFVFILNDKDIRQVSAYATGLEEMLKQVEQIFNADLVGRLASSTDWSTRILWPTKLRGQEIFKIIERTPTSFWEKAKLKLGLLKQEMELTDNLKDYLK